MDVRPGGDDPERTVPQAAGLLWCLLGAAALLGGLSGSVVRRVGQAAGAALLGAAAGAAGAPVSFVAAAGLVSVAALAAPRDRRRTSPDWWSGRRRHR